MTSFIVNNSLNSEVIFSINLNIMFVHNPENVKMTF